MSSAHQQWTRNLQAWANQHGAGEPRLIIDLARFLANCERAAALTRQHGKAVRLVQKSLPCMPLLRHASQRLNTQRLMIFHRPFLNLYAQHWPESDLLLGKPLPVAAAAEFYRQLPGTTTFRPERQLQWLIDSAPRLQQYQQLARQLGTRLRINLEIDVGMHRGGLHDPQQLGNLLQCILDDPQHLEFAGFMGYDAHAAKAPFWTSSQAALEQANARYRAFCRVLQEQFPALWQPDLCLNGAGSPTFTRHDQHSPLNEVSFGSCLVKPGDFELPSLNDFNPAMLIATPALKISPGLQLPYLEAASELLGKLRRPSRKTLFIYGGKWMANPCWPSGLKPNALYGRSSNQELLTAPAHTALAVDDNVLLRPTQSEALMLQFGDLLIRQDDDSAQSWAVDEAQQQAGLPA